MSFSTLKTKLLTVVSANTKINEAFGYDKPRFNKTPVATVVPSGNESSYATTANNKRTYGFTITVFVPYDVEGALQAEATLTEVIDSLLDDLDNAGALDGECLMMSSSPSKWGFMTREKEYRVATIEVKCLVYFQTN